MLPTTFDPTAFLAELDALRADLETERARDSGAADRAHLCRVEAAAWGASATGWALIVAGAWPLAALALALGRFVRWTCVAHHVLHKGYDGVAAMPLARTSRGYAQGWRRLLDWPDPMLPAAWVREHNQLHHFRLGELDDPDLVEENAKLLQPAWAPLPLRLLFVLGVACTWRWLYFAPAAIREWQDQRRGHHDPPERAVRMDARMLLPWGRGADVWRHCYLPFAALTLIVGPALLGAAAAAWASSAGDDAAAAFVTVAASAVAASVVAELLVNVHSFAVIVTNHAGADLWRFDSRVRGRAELVLRQIVGSVNFRTGGWLNDLLHGHLNYQIEHHVWPDLSMRQLSKVQPQLRALCARHGVPYAQDRLDRRVRLLVRAMVGRDVMRRTERVVPGDDLWRNVAP